MSRARDPLDPSRLIREAYAIDGIDAMACRAIFFDWALGAKQGEEASAAAALLARYGAAHPDHPMTAILRQAADADTRPRRRRRRG